MRTIREIHEEIERLSEERVELWHQLSTEYDPQIREQIRGIDTALDGLWDEQRALRARVRFGASDLVEVACGAVQVRSRRVGQHDPLGSLARRTRHGSCIARGRAEPARSGA